MPRRAPITSADAGSPPAHAPPAGSLILRRAPQQARGERRVARILDAAAAVIAEHGVDAASVNDIAERARTAKGSIYQFFPTKEAIVHALLARYVAELGALSEAVLRPDLATLPFVELVERTVEPMAAWHFANPALRHVYYAVTNPRFATRPDADLTEAVVALIEGLIAARLPTLPSAARRRGAVVINEIVHALLGLAVLAGPAERPALVTELKRAVVAYAEALERER